MAESFTESHFSRLLVYDDDIDRVVGVIHQKDFYTGNGVTAKPIRDIITQPIFIHPTEKVSDLLKLLQSNQSHIAIVIDEYGGTLGIVTMEAVSYTHLAQVLSYLNRVGGESDNLLFGQDGFPMPVEREAVFLSRQQQEEKSLMLVGFVGEELVCVASCDALTARERVAHRASVSVTVGKVFWRLGIGRKRCV